jgi:hypothetical protein
MNVNFDGSLFAISQLLDKTLIARVPVPVYSNPYTQTQIATVSTGSPIGTIYSYVGGVAGAPLYWMFLRPDGSAYYIEHFSNRFNVSLLQQQGVLTVEQEIEQQQEQQNDLFPGFEIPSIDLGNVALIAGIVIGGLVLLNLTKK